MRILKWFVYHHTLLLLHAFKAVYTVHLDVLHGL